ncbi:hypothetical protein ACJMK2_044083 [Sinanodonta woodiana]|uniref:Nuclear receptor 2C2-associated protein n=1 Tax=Sinanodonta woodiana TaxID=1069815 RepID=A0ABD3VZH6_SINWO
MAASLVGKCAQVRVSSVLNRDVKQFGKKHLFDGKEDTCWNSDQGSPQWIEIQFQTSLKLQELHIQFQGGFAGRECSIEGSEVPGREMKKIAEFYPEDVNSLQIFQLPGEPTVASLKILFLNSTDFFGRITIYKLDIKGQEVS